MLSEKIKELYFALRYKKIPSYIHIPKTAGTYLAQLESNKNTVIWPIKRLGHTCVVTTKDNRVKIYPPKVGFLPNYITQKKEIANNLVFATVRNIFSWLVSYAAHAGGWNPKYNDPTHYDYENSKKGFDYFLKTIANRDGDIWPNRKMIHFQIFSDDGELVTDWLNRIETLDSDLEALARYCGVHYQKREKQRVSVKEDYKKYYNDNLVDIVYQTWGREMKLFGYAFDDSNIESAILKRQIDKETKERIKYYWQEDRLLVGGKELK